MSKYLIVDGDTLKFGQKFGINTVTPTGPTIISGSGTANIQNKKICIVGDEKKVSIAASYFNESHAVPGTGMITIAALAADQQAPFATAQTPVIVVGSQFTATFTPISPASDPNSGPDAPTPTSGSGTFSNSQSFVTAG